VITTTASKSQWDKGAFTTYITASQISTLTVASVLSRGKEARESLPVMSRTTAYYR